MAARTYSVLGTGALGGYYGARLVRGGADVRFLLYRDYDHVREAGLRVESVEGDFSIAKPQIFARAQDLPPSDVVLVALKTTQNEHLRTLLPAAVHEGAVVLVMQNGLGIEEFVAELVPGNTVLGGLAFLCSNKIGPGHIRHLDYGGIRLAEYREDGRAAGRTVAVEAVAEDFRKAGIPVELEDDLSLARWKKLLWNIPYNGLCVVHDCATDVIMGAPGTRALCEEIMEEVRAVAAACGHPIDPGFQRAMLRTTDAMSSYLPSMKLDHQEGRPLELQALYEKPLEAARNVGVACPRIESLYRQLVECDPGRAR